MQWLHCSVTRRGLQPAEPQRSGITGANRKGDEDPSRPCSQLWARGFPATVRAAGHTCRGTSWNPRSYLIRSQSRDPPEGPLREASGKLTCSHIPTFGSKGLRVSLPSGWPVARAPGRARRSPPAPLTAQPPHLHGGPSFPSASLTGPTGLAASNLSSHLQ